MEPCLLRASVRVERLEALNDKGSKPQRLYTLQAFQKLWQIKATAMELGKLAADQRLAMRGEGM